MGLEYLLDTNILLRLARAGERAHPGVHRAIRELLGQEARICICPQVLVELWNVMTRPVERNGFGLTVAEVEAEVRLSEEAFELLPEIPEVHLHWRRLVLQYGVRGRQVHDARLVAVMAAHGIGRLLTLNGGDFVRYDRKITVVDPAEAGPAG